MKGFVNIMVDNKEKSITRQKLFSILSNIIDTSDVFCNSLSTNKSIVSPDNILLMDSNENEYINNNNNNININNLNDDDELQLIVKFSNTDIDDAHTWVEKLIIQLKLENNCEIVDEGDFDESSIIAIFIIVKLALFIVKILSKFITKLPGLKQMDHIGGAICGAIEGIMFVYFVFAVISISAPALEETKIIILEKLKRCRKDSKRKKLKYLKSLKR